jgi:hypothetical protein
LVQAFPAFHARRWHRQEWPQWQPERPHERSAAAHGRPFISTGD